MSSIIADTSPYATSPLSNTPARTLTVWKIIVLIVAALTPISVVVGTLPLGLAFGGPSTTLAFLAAGIIVGLFCVGYSEMVRRITRPGAFYNYIARGLGRPTGVASAMIAVVGYPSGLIAAYAAGAFVYSTTLQSLGIPLSFGWSFVALAVIVALMVWRQIDLSAIVSGIIVVLELLLIFALVVMIAKSKGVAAFPLDIVSPVALNYGDWSVAFIFSFLVYQGFEAGALYAPEAKEPARTIPRALFGALVILTATFFFASWALSALTPPDKLMAVVAEKNMVGFVFDAVSTYLGTSGLWIFSVVTMLATTACTLAVTNFMARYLNGLAQDHLLPSFLARFNKHGAPGNSAFTLIAFASIVTGACGLFGVDAYTELTPIGFGIGAIGTTVLQALSSASVIGFFMREPANERHWWKTTLAPIIATLLLIGAIVIELQGFGYITGSSQPWTNFLPWVVAVAFVVGMTFALWLKSARPNIYANIAAGDSAEEAAMLRREAVTLASA